HTEARSRRPAPHSPGSDPPTVSAGSAASSRSRRRRCAGSVGRLFECGMSWIRLAEDPGRATSVPSEIWAGPFAVSRAALRYWHGLKREICSVLIIKQFRVRLSDFFRFRCPSIGAVDARCSRVVNARAGKQLPHSENLKARVSAPWRLKESCACGLATHRLRWLLERDQDTDGRLLALHNSTKIAHLRNSHMPGLHG